MNAKRQSTEASIKVAQRLEPSAQPQAATEKTVPEDYRSPWAQGRKQSGSNGTEGRKQNQRAVSEPTQESSGVRTSRVEGARERTRTYHHI